METVVRGGRQTGALHFERAVADVLRVVTAGGGG